MLSPYPGLDAVIVEKGFKLLKKFQTVAALLLIASVAMAAFEVYVYRRDRDYLKLLYAQSVNIHDMRDASRNAVTALQDAEIHGADYILTGRAASREAYRNSARDWQDESGTLEVLAEHDPAIVPIRDLSKTGTGMLDELAATVSLYDGGSHEAALDRLRKSPGVGDLEHVRDQMAKIDKLDIKALNANDHSRTNVAILSMRRILRGAGALFCLAFAGISLLLWQTRRGLRAAGSPASDTPRPAATVG